MSTKPAEHYGHCQACDRMQKLPDGLLAKHGYQVAGYGYFAGVCRGSAHLPYEMECAYIRDTIIPEAKIEEQTLIEYCAKIRITPIEPKGYHQIYTPIGSVWNKLRILGEPEYKYPVIEVGKSKYNQTGVEPSHRFTWLPSFNDARPETLLKLAAAMNEYYAAHIERYDLLKIRRYIQWQEKRVADWKLRPLPPVDLAKELRKKSEKEFNQRQVDFVAQEDVA